MASTPSSSSINRSGGKKSIKVETNNGHRKNGMEVDDVPTPPVSKRKSKSKTSKIKQEKEQQPVTQDDVDVSQMDTQDFVSQMDTQNLVSQMDTQDLISQTDPDAQDISQVDTQDISQQGGNESILPSPIVRPRTRGRSGNTTATNSNDETLIGDNTSRNKEREAISRSQRKRKAPEKASASRSRLVLDESTEPSSDSQDSDADDLSLPPPDGKRRRRPSTGSINTTVSRARASKKLRDFKKATQKQAGNFATSSSGIVKSIKMYNFMCHDGFYQEWHPNLNFITGENGSGKSALLTALLIGLGAKAVATSRTKSMASLIQKGKDSARTEITLINNGLLPEDRYGNEIMIERTLSKSGSSTYRVKCGNEKLKKMKKHELDHILMSFNIQLNNPVAILNQEVAKNFLRTKDPKDKYQLFFRGTLLSDLFELMDRSKSNIAGASDNLKYHKHYLEDLRKEVHALELRLKEVQSLTNLKRDLEKLGKEFVWVMAIEQEKIIEDLESQINERDSKISEFKQQLTTAETNRRKLEEEAQGGDDIRELQTKMRQKEREAETVRRDGIEANKSKATYQQMAKRTKDQLRTKERSKKDLQAAVDTIKTTSEAAKEKAQREYAERKETLLKEREKVQNEIQALKHDTEQFYADMEKKRQDLDDAERQFKAQSFILDSKKKTINELQSSTRSKFLMFGPKMDELVKLVKANERKFKKLPKGPVAAFVTVKDKRFTAIAEYIMKSKGFLTSFIVDNGDDLVVLKDLIKRVYGQTITPQHPSMKVNRFQDRPYDLRAYKSRIPGAPTLLEILEIDDNDPVIYNGLVDYVNAERILMFESNEAAARVMKHKEQTTNVRQGYTLDWYQFYPAPNYAAHPINKAGGQFLRSSQTSLIETLKQEIVELEEEVQGLRPALNEKKRGEAEVRERYNRMQQMMTQKNRALENIKNDLKKNEDRKYKEPDITSQMEQLHDINEEIERMVNDIEKNEKLVTEYTDKATAAEKEKEDLKCQIAKIQRKLDEGEANRRQKERQLQAEKSTVESLNTKIKQLEKSKEPAAEKIKQAKEKYDKRIKNAQDNGGEREQFASTRQPEAVRRDIDQVKVRIQTMQDTLGDIDKLQRDYDKKEEEFETKRQAFKPIFDMFIILKDVVKCQSMYLLERRELITLGLKYTFKNLAQQRKYQGQITIDHDKKELHFFICPDESSAKRTDSVMSQSQKGRSPNDPNAKKTSKTLTEYSLGLSGGERSFSTICFILSLWQVMECPFYMLDEFDVFMDAFNRKVSQQALMIHAKAHPDRQFFLFSPLDLVELPSKEEASVIRLRPARPDPNPNESIENVDPSGSRSSHGGGRNKRQSRLYRLLRTPPSD